MYRAIEAPHTEIDRKKGTLRAVVSDDSLDRHGTILDPEGIEWDDYMRAGGPILFEHGLCQRGRLPIGNCENLERTNFKGRRSILAQIRLDDDDEFTRKIKRKYFAQTMRGWSVRGLPLDFSRPDERERRARPDDWGKAEMIYRRWSLCEVSAVSVNSNVNALTQDINRSAGGGDWSAVAGIGESYYFDSLRGSWAVIGLKHNPENDQLTLVRGVPTVERSYKRVVIGYADDENLAKLMCSKGR